MTGVLRFVGILNAAVWCGSAIFVAAGVPALFSPELKRLLTPAGVGFAAEAVIGRFFVVQYCCGAIALAHLLAGRLYSGHAPRRWTSGLALGLLLLALLGGLWVQPKMRDLHAVKYFGKTVAQQTQAAKTFALWHAASQAANVVAIAGLTVYLWQVCIPLESPRFGTFTKFRG